MKTYLKLFWHFDRQCDSPDPRLERLITLPYAAAYFALAIATIAIFPVNYKSEEAINISTMHLFAITVASLAGGLVFLYRVVAITMPKVRNCLEK